MHVLYILYEQNTVTTQRMRFFSKNFFSKCCQVHSFLRIRSHLLKKSLVENFIFVQCFSIFLLLFWRPFDSQDPNRIFGTRNAILFTENSICWRNAEIVVYDANMLQKYLRNICVCVYVSVCICVYVFVIFLLLFPSRVGRTWASKSKCKIDQADFQIWCPSYHLVS